MISVEEGAIGGFGEHVSRFLLSENLLGGGQRLKFSPMGLPDRHAPPPSLSCSSGAPCMVLHDRCRDSTDAVAVRCHTIHPSHVGSTRYVEPAAAPPCRFIEHGTQADQLEEAGLTAWHIAHTALSMLGKKKDVAAIMSSMRAH